MATAGFHGRRTWAVCSRDQERDSQCLIFGGVIRDRQGSRRGGEGWEGEEFAGRRNRICRHRPWEA